MPTPGEELKGFIARAFSTSRLFFYGSILLVVLIITLGYLGFANLERERQEIEKNKETIVDLSVELQNLQKRFNEEKQKYQKESEELGAKVDFVLPPSEELTPLVRFLEDYTNKNHSSLNPMFLSNLNLGNSQTDEGKTYSYMPADLNLNISLPNFYKFLEMIEDSGDLESNNLTRLMEVEKVGITFPKKDESTADISLGLNIFNQKIPEKASSL
ncbi:MAG TPA: hypothetical protein ENI70_00650 [Candidatus Peregrinibacteria bacterium]|nr:hypothetical protein [Candidatus Peregrinibacteria bacterium]